jgi:signal transduction histidine kinase
MSFAAGAPQLSPAPLELDGLIESVWAELINEMAADDATISHGTLPKLHSDATILSTVLKHILGNALLYRSAAAPHVEVTAERSASDWLLHISDNGRGIEPAYQDRIFEPFWKLPQAGVVPGAGLGLTAARELLAAMGGNLTLGRSDETGSYFTIRLPAA